MLCVYNVFELIKIINKNFSIHFFFFFRFYFKNKNKKGLITTTARKLDRENQPEHILEVNIFVVLSLHLHLLHA